MCLWVFVASLVFRILIWKLYPHPYDFAHFLLTQAGGLAAGAWLAMAYRGPEWSRVLSLAPWAIALGLIGFSAVGIVTNSFEANTTLMLTVGLPAVTILFAGLLAMALQPGLFERFFSIAWLRWLGNISYGVYVFHVLLLPVIGWVAKSLAAGRSQMVFNLIQFVVAAVLSLACATLSFRLFESRFLSLKRYFIPQPRPRQIAV